MCIRDSLYPTNLNLHVRKGPSNSIIQKPQDRIHEGTKIFLRLATDSNCSIRIDIGRFSSRSYLNRMILITHDSLTKEACIGAYLFSKQVVRLVRKSVFWFTSLYLKQCSSSRLRRYSEATRIVACTSLPQSIRVSSYHPSHRRMMMRKDDRADVLVKLYLSLGTRSSHSCVYLSFVMVLVTLSCFRHLSFRY